MLLLDGFAIILPKFKTIKLHIIVNDTIQISLKRHSPHFSGGESPADAVVAFVKSSTFCEVYGIKSVAAVLCRALVEVSFSQFSVFNAPTSSGATSAPLYFHDFVFPFISSHGLALCYVLCVSTLFTTRISANMQEM